MKEIKFKACIQMANELKIVPVRTMILDNKGRLEKIEIVYPLGNNMVQITTYRIGDDAVKAIYQEVML